MEKTWEFVVVSTSAEQLYSVLNGASLKRDDLKLGYGITKAIGAPLEDTSIAMKYMSNLVMNINADLEVSFEDPLLAHMKTLMQPFQKLLNFSIYDQTCRNLGSQGNLLSSRCVNGLLGVDAALQGKCERPTLTASDEVLASVSSLRNTLQEIELPENVQRILNKRIDQFEDAIRQFKFYGVTGMNEAMEALLGSVELYVPQKKKFKPAYSQLRGAVFTTFLVVSTAVATTNNAVKDGVELIENIQDGSKLLEDFRKSVSKSGSEEE